MTVTIRVAGCMHRLKDAKTGSTDTAFGWFGPLLAMLQLYTGFPTRNEDIND